jgi:hypothetical protein
MGQIGDEMSDHDEMSCCSGWVVLLHIIGSAETAVTIMVIPAVAATAEATSILVLVAMVRLGARGGNRVCVCSRGHMFEFVVSELGT